eukprot:Nitzschia sp. Nitz4//scaffold28_size193895//93482//94234//NITZ4_001657-RA/size193895-processed-gene-0.265-mRNA-1//-1//CDS//3329545958//5392//frame0
MTTVPTSDEPTEAASPEKSETDVPPQRMRDHMRERMTPRHSNEHVGFARPITLANASTAESEASHSHLFERKDNVGYKWQRARDVVGALEVVSEPEVRVREPMQKHEVHGRERTFHDALKAWETLKLREDFIKACDKLPAQMCCCGFMRDQDATKRDYVQRLNEGWVKHVNKELMKEGKGIKLDVFLWNWQNASGKAETNIVLIRFFELSSYRFRRASKDGSQDFELFDPEDLAELDDSDSPDQDTMDRN